MKITSGDEHFLKAAQPIIINLEQVWAAVKFFTRISRIGADLTAKNSPEESQREAGNSRKGPNFFPEHANTKN